MRFAILCPGPSLASLPDDLQVDRIIGVNRAVVRRPCTWWAATDWQVVAEVGAACSGLITTRESLKSLQRKGLWHGPAVVSEDLWLHFPPIVSQWTRYTLTMALVAASWLDATRIDVYGNDRTNAPDWDGGVVNAAGQNRTCVRWADEAGIWTRTVGVLEARGIEIVNHGLAGKS